MATYMAGERLPFLYTVEHARSDFGEYSDRCALSEERRVRFSDIGTLRTVPRHAYVVAGQFSRGLIDLNRAPDDQKRFPSHDFAKPKPNKIWIPGQEPTEAEQAAIQSKIYTPYHNRILEIVQGFTKPGIVVSWHNTAHYEIGQDQSGKMQMMRPFILSNQGLENRPDGPDTSCDPQLFSAIATYLRRNLRRRNLPSEVLLNFVYRGGYTSEHYNSHRHPELGLQQPVNSLQLEYDHKMTNDPRTLEQNRTVMESIKGAFEESLVQAYLDFYKITVH